MTERHDIQTQDKHRISRILWFLYCIFLIASLVVIGKIIYIQYFWEPKEQTVENFLPKNTEEDIKPERGSIYDCNGKLLAISTPLYTVHVDCQVLKSDMAKGKVKARGIKDSLDERLWRDLTKQMCSEFPAILQEGRSADSYYDSIIVNRESNKKSGRRHMLLVKDIDHSTLKRLQENPFFRAGKYTSGMKVSKQEARKYPYDKLGGRVIGDVRIDPNDPARNRFVGLEGQYDYILHGKEGKQWMKETDKGSIINPDSTVIAVENGKDIRTTIDINIQDIADKALREHITEDAGIQGGCVVVMDVQTGAVRAMVNLLRNSKGELGESLNMAIGRPGEPGSVFKAVTLTTLLEDGKVTLDTEVETNRGVFKEYPKASKDQALIRYEQSTGKKKITVREGFKRSSNNVFRHLVVKHYGDDPKAFTDRLYEYKLHNSYEFDLKETGYGVSELRKSWDFHDLYSTAIGYSIRETPLNMLTFYNAIANNGKMMKPYLIDAHIKDGKVVKTFKPEILNASICSKATADTLTEALKLVAKEGTARKLRDAKCEIAGKTGTARTVLDPGEKPQKRDPYMTEDGKRKYQATFVGFFPADEPRYSAIVTVYTVPTLSDGYGGGNQPTRVFKDIVDHLWALDPNWGEELKERSDVPDMKAQYIGTRKGGGGPLPDVVGMGLKDAIYAIENNGYKCEYEGMGHVVRQSPKGGQTCKKGQTIHLVLQ